MCQGTPSNQELKPASPGAAVTWHSQPAASVLETLEAEASGLTAEAVAQRLATHGANEFQEQPRPGFGARLLNHFKNIVVLLLIVASFLSGALGEWPEAIAILLIVLLNAILGVVQEGRAEQALNALKKLAAPDATVRRAGKTQRVPERQLVPGDIVLLEAGNFVPADLRLLETHNLKIDEATLTGESVPAGKDASQVLPEKVPLGERRNMAYKSTTVTYGRAVGVVVNTGLSTEIGLIACLLQNVADEATPLQKRLDGLGRSLVYGALSLCGLLFLLTLYRDMATLPGGLSGAWSDPAGRNVIKQSVLNAFLTSISLAIAAVPEGLPAIVTINLALGMREMIRRHAIIRRLHAVETLGSVSVICSDKTGTLTQNEMTVVRLHVADVRLDVSGTGYAPRGAFHREGNTVTTDDIPDVRMLLTAAVLSSDAHLESSEAETVEAETVFKITGDPTEGALVVAAAKAGLHRAKLEDLYPRLDEIPFDAARRRMGTLHRSPSAEQLLFVKGAPDAVLERCETALQGGDIVELTDARREHIHNLNRDLARQALRVIAVAYRRFASSPQSLNSTHESDLTWIGLIAMQDAPRPEVAAAIAKARRAGIRVVMITGDSADTAHAIALQIGLCDAGGRVAGGDAIENLSDAELRRLVTEVSVYARVSPSQKVRIAQALRACGHIVAMTGDGVNDAPALKSADIGVAMGITGADVTKETADMVLVDDNFASIVGAVEQGRVIYGNIRKFVAFLLGCNLAEIAIILVATLLGYPCPLTPLQILWLNLITDGAPALALGLEKGDHDAMERPPRPPHEPIVDRHMQVGIAVQTVAISAATLTAFFMTLRGSGQGSNIEQARTVAFVTLSLIELLVAYTYRSDRISLRALGLWSNHILQYAVGASLMLLLVVVYVPFLQPVFGTFPLSGRVWLEILCLSLLPPLAAEVTKWSLRRYDDRRIAPPGPRADSAQRIGSRSI